MKKTKLFSLLLVSLLTISNLLTGCEPKDKTSTFELSSSSLDLMATQPIKVPNTEKIYSITVKTSPEVAWNATIVEGSEFVEITPKGEQKGDGTINITISKNPLFTDRDAAIRISNKLNDKKTDIRFTQTASGKPTITFDPSNKFNDVDAIGETLSVTITTEPVTPLIFVNDNPWITQSTTEPAKWTINANTEKTPRTGKVYIKYATDKTLDSLVFTQNGKSADPVRFAVMSDVHFGSGDAVSKVSNSLKTICRQTPKVDAIFVVGDITDYGRQDQYNSLIKTYTDNVPTDIPVYFMMGNHDRYGDADGTLYTNTVKQPFNQYVEIKDMPFITLSVSSTSNSGTSCYSTETKDYLAEKMATANTKFPGKPIFLFYHVPTENTIWGTLPGPDNWSSTTLQSTVNKYKQTIAFSGHTHFPIGDERSIHQREFTSINDGGNTYGELLNGLSDGVHPAGSQEVTEVLIVDVKENLDVVVSKIDTYRNLPIKQPWIIKAPHDGSMFTYTDARKNETSAPSFTDGTKPTIDNISDAGCKITFKQASDDDLVYSYQIQVLDKNNAVAQTYEIFSQFWLGQLTPLSLSWSIIGLTPGETYSASVKAKDSFSLLSSAIVSEKFTTSTYVPDPGSKAPVADLLDIMFSNTGASDIAPLSIPVTQGPNKPATAYDPTTKLWASTHSGSTSTFFKADYSKSDALKNGMKSSFTYEVYCKTTATGDICPFSGQESAGIGFEQDGLNGEYKVWTNLTDDTYKPVFRTVNNTDYYHMILTYDGSKLSSYVNGTLVQTMDATGDLKFPQEYPDDNAQWFCIGGDATWTSRTNCQYAFKGNIALARIYSKAASKDEVYRIYEQITNRQKIAEFDQLNTAITVTIPAMVDGAGKDQLLVEGWSLMNNMATTKTEITTFLAKLN